MSRPENAVLVEEIEAHVRANNRKQFDHVVAPQGFATALPGPVTRFVSFPTKGAEIGNSTMPPAGNAQQPQ